MGGFGSGRKRSPHATPTTSGLKAIDIRRWQREGLLRLGFSFTRVWHQHGQPVAQIRVRPLGDRLQVTYSRGPLEKTGASRSDIIHLVRTTCHLGGNRPWFLCPRPGCGRRVAVLYGHEGFACRQCLGLAYPSQRESAAERVIRKAERVRQRLGWEPWECSATGRRPKGMHKRTFRRLQVLRACLMIQALGGAKQRLNSISRILSGRNQSKSQRAQAPCNGGNIGGNSQHAN